jgi:uncharacterized protein YecT (DUF1311 family)
MRSILISACVIVGTIAVSSVPGKTQNRDIRGCLSIADIDERVECLEGRAPASVGPTRPNLELRGQPQRVSPSFDCRLARSSIERAICSDNELAGWDSRMGQAFQQALSAQQDPRGLLESQRRWIKQRDRTCGATPQIPFSCLLKMTQDRTTALSQLATGAAEATVQSPIPQTDVDLSPPQPATAELQPPRPAVRLKAAQSSTESDGPGPLIVLLGIGLALWLGSKALSAIRYKQRRRNLVAKYGEETADKILAHKVWQGMTNEQLLESWGKPVGIGNEVRHRKTKQTWKYNQTGKNRFAGRVYLENDVVVGWKV